MLFWDASFQDQGPETVCFPQPPHTSFKLCRNNDLAINWLSYSSQAFNVFWKDFCLPHTFYIYSEDIYSKGFKLAFIINLWKLFKLFCAILSIANTTLTETINPTPFTNVGKAQLLFNILHIFKYNLILLIIITFLPIIFLQSYLPFHRYVFNIHFQLNWITSIFFPFFQTTSHYLLTS